MIHFQLRQFHGFHRIDDEMHHIVAIYPILEAGRSHHYD